MALDRVMNRHIRITRLAPKHLQPRVRGWLLGSADGGRTSGLLPANRVKVIGKRLGSDSDERNKTKAAPDVIGDTFEEAFK